MTDQAAERLQNLGDPPCGAGSFNSLINSAYTDVVPWHNIHIVTSAIFSCWADFDWLFLSLINFGNLSCLIFRIPNHLKSSPLDLTKCKQLWNPFMLSFKNIQISKDRKLLMLSINVPEWVCLCLSRKAIEILRQRWRRTSNWKVCTLWHQHRGCANLKTFLSLSFLHLNFQSSINWFLYTSRWEISGFCILSFCQIERI